MGVAGLMPNHRLLTNEIKSIGKEIESCADSMDTDRLHGLANRLSLLISDLGIALKEEEGQRNDGLPPED